MYKKVNIPIIGLVENMASVTCPSCSNHIKIFGEETSSLASEINTKILQSFPLDQNISCSTDKGAPIVVKDPNSKQSKLYISLAKQVVDFIDKSKNIKI